MASISYASKEISVKIVYYGPGMSGKTSNLKLIYNTILPEHRSKMVSIATENERTLFFDFLPLDLGRIKGFKVKLQLYTVPGQVYYNATRKLVLRGADGIVFVADSSPDKIEENVESFVNLEENLIAYKYKLENIPLVIQYNKRDIPNAVPIEVMQKHINKLDYKWTEAVANKGTGVFDTLKLISVKVIEDINRKYLQSFRRQPSPARSNAPQTGAAVKGDIKRPSVQTQEVRPDSQMQR
jgi:signal recognition particle receptor subunit beta